jgi:hypothetical protein
MTGRGMNLRSGRYLPQEDIFMMRHLDTLKKISMGSK